MRAWMLPAGSDGFDKLYLEERPDPAPGPGEVLIQMQAWSINYRDFAVAAGKYFGGALKQPSIPLSDGAGVVAAVGPGVTRFKEGDRVQGAFFTAWEDGPPKRSMALGDGMGPGVLAELVVLPESGVVPMAQSLDFAQAACLPCAGVTAWNALHEGSRPLRPGDRVLVLGSGGVSLLALQIARASGCEVIATSSSDEKLARVRELGAAHTVNYKTTPEWGAWIAQHLGGVDKVVEVGGAGTAEQSMNALRTQGDGQGAQRRGRRQRYRAADRRTLRLRAGEGSLRPRLGPGELRQDRDRAISEGEEAPSLCGKCASRRPAISTTTRSITS